VSARRTIVAAGLLTAALQLAPPPDLLAQLAPGVSSSRSRAPQAERRTPRRVLFSLAGALVGMGATAFYFTTAEAGDRGNCSSRNCVVPVSVVGSAVVGYLVGREFDQLHALRYRGGRPLSPRAVSVTLDGEPVVLAASDSLVAVGGLGGVQVFTSGASALRAGARRAAGVRGIKLARPLARQRPHRHRSRVGILRLPPGHGTRRPGARWGTSAAIPAGNRIFVAVGNRVEAVPVGADTVRSWPGIELGISVGSLAYDAERSILWALSDSALMALRPDGDSLTLVGTTKLDATGRRVIAGRAAARDRVRRGRRPALRRGHGDGGAGDRALVRCTLRVRRVVRRRAALRGGRPRGVYVLDASGTTLTVAGLARELGFATALATRGEYTFVLDRAGSALRRIRSDF
jgi:hypothetical protein